MKQAKTTIYILLLLFAVFAVVISIPFVLVYRIVKVVFTRKFDPTWFYRMAISLDQFANVAGDDLLNKLLTTKKSCHHFGDEDETISSVMGRNHLDNTLTFLGDILRKILHRMDKNHSVNAIEK